MVVNMYGSTETQVLYSIEYVLITPKRAVSYFAVPSGEQFEKMKEILPAGQGMKDASLIVFNSENKLAGVGELGEIYMRSPHLAKGYKGLPGT